MKRAAILFAAIWMLTGAAGLADVTGVTLDGSVICGPADSLTAPMGGTVSAVYALPGDYLKAGDPVAALSLTKVFAPCAGTVEAVFAQAGESADDAVSRYGGVIALAPESAFTVYATSDDAYRSVRAGRVVPGQAVYMKCTRDGSHVGTGVVTQTDGELIFIEATGGAFHNGEAVNVYMEPDYDAEDRIARGTALATVVESVTATGDVYRTCVQPGDFVEKGQLLMETLGALPEDGDAGDCVIAAEEAGYVTAVSVKVGDTLKRDGLLLSYCPADGLLVSVMTPEEDLATVAEGAPAVVTLELAEETLRLEGIVKGVSYIPETTRSGDMAYRALIALPADERVSPGMDAVVTIME